VPHLVAAVQEVRDASAKADNQNAVALALSTSWLITGFLDTLCDTTHLMHAALGGATACSQRLRVFVPHDFGLQTIRVAEEDAQGRAEIGNGAIRGS
jgi:hypothetical protein